MLKGGRGCDEEGEERRKSDSVFKDKSESLLCNQWV